MNPLPKQSSDSNHPSCLGEYAKINAVLVENTLKSKEGEKLAAWVELSRKHSAGLWGNIWANIPRIKAWREELYIREQAIELENAGPDSTSGKLTALKLQISEWMSYTKALMALDRQVKALLRRHEKKPLGKRSITRLWIVDRATTGASPVALERIWPPLGRHERELLQAEIRCQKARAGRSK